MAYESCATSLVVNKRERESIRLFPSVRKYCPLLPLLFCIFLEPFCLSVTQIGFIRGFELEATEMRILAYADDVAIFCVDSEGAKEAVELTEIVFENTGCSVNSDTCLSVCHGDWPSTPAVLKRVVWTELPSSYLGVPLEHYRNNDDYWRYQVEALRINATKLGGYGVAIFAGASDCSGFLFANV